MFYQVLILLAMVGGVYVTCMFAVMPNKSGPSYLKVFSMIHDAFSIMGLDVNWRNHSFMMDFEIAMRNCVQSILLLLPFLEGMYCVNFYLYCGSGFIVNAYFLSVCNNYNFNLIEEDKDSMSVIHLPYAPL